ncbi:general secretion pathway protein GspB [Haliea sp. E17]|uniref:general secretion pathway protein GspB n=1 Tax=Haliea sp. E17 TaxID=3401576 RepID=UPI003AAE7E82
MSLILDALNRSRQDTGEVPGLHSQPPEAPAAARLPLVLSLAALLLALVVIGWLVLGPDRDTGDPVAAAPNSVASPAQALAPAAVEPRTPLPAGAVQEVAAPQPTRESPSQAQPRVEPAAATEPPRESAPAPAISSRPQSEPASQDPAVAALYQHPPQVQQAADATAPNPAPSPSSARPQQPARAAAESEQAIDIDALVRQAENQLADGDLGAHPAPLLSQLSQQTKDAIPTLLYSAHGYSGKPGQSTVVLNGKQLKVGGSPAAGVKIEEILPDSVVLSFRGEKFRLRALNSWVNL